MDLGSAVTSTRQASRLGLHEQALWLGDRAMAVAMGSLHTAQHYRLQSGAVAPFPELEQTITEVRQRLHDLFEQAERLASRLNAPVAAALAGASLTAAVVGAPLPAQAQEVEAPVSVPAPAPEATTTPEPAEPDPPVVAAVVEPADVPPEDAPTEATAPEEEAPTLAPTPDEEEPTPAPPAEGGSGWVNVVVPGGWGDVYRRGRSIGRAPGRLRLPAGDHVLEVRVFGQAPGRMIRVHVEADETTTSVVRDRGGPR